MLFFLVVWTMTTHGKFSDSGDEPHYLMVAESIVSDGDLDVGNNYRNGDGRWFGADTLEAGPHARVTRQGATWSTHDVGVPVILTPIYAVASRVSRLVPNSFLTAIRQPRGLFAYSLVSLTLVALTAFGMSLVISGWTRREPPSYVLAAAAVLALSPPVLSHAFLVFPETLALFVISAVVWTCCLARHELSQRRMFCLALAVGCLPWLHRKYSLLALGVMLLVAYQQRQWFRRQSPSSLATLLALVALPQLALHAWTWHAWGNIGGPQMLDSLPFSISGIQRGSLGLLLDRERGLAGYAPIYLVLPACWVLAWRDVRAYAVPIALLFFPMAAFAVWSAGFSPAARYLVPLMPLLAAPIPRAMGYSALKWIALPFALMQLAVTAAVWQTPRTLWPKEQGTNGALELLGAIGRAYERLLPSMMTGDSVLRGWTTAVAIALFTMVVVAVCRRNAPAGRTGAPGVDR